MLQENHQYPEFGRLKFVGIDVEIQFIRAKLSWNFNVTKIPELGFLMIWLFCTAVVTVTAEKEGPLRSS